MPGRNFAMPLYEAIEVSDENDQKNCDPEKTRGCAHRQKVGEIYSRLVPGMLPRSPNGLAGRSSLGPPVKPAFGLPFG
jgi:hypothetical protein